MTGKKLFKGCHYLLLKNADKLKPEHTTRLDNLLSNNSNLNTLYILKEQLQELWQLPTFNQMTAGINAWCELAYETNMHKKARTVRLSQVVHSSECKSHLGKDGQPPSSNHRAGGSNPKC